MADLTLNRDVGGVPIQAFPLKKDRINITTGTITDCKLVCCSVDGSITLNTYAATIAMVAGDVFAFHSQSVTVVSGTFHLA